MTCGDKGKYVKIRLLIPTTFINATHGCGARAITRTENRKSTAFEMRWRRRVLIIGYRHKTQQTGLERR